MPYNSKNAVQASGKSGGAVAGIAGALMSFQKTQSRLAEFEHKEGIKRETYVHRKSVDNVSKRQQGQDQFDLTKQAYEHFNGGDESNTGFRYGPLNVTRETEAQRKRATTMSSNAETAKEKEERLAKERAQSTESAQGPKQQTSNSRRSRKKAEETAATDSKDPWAATAPRQSNVSKPNFATNSAGVTTSTAPKVRKPRAPRAPKNPGQSGGMQ